MSTQSIRVSQESHFSFWAVLSTGMALFSMFFGAGNLIFPLIIGKLAGGGVLYALLGLGISAVVFPFLGLIAMMLYEGNIQAFLQRLGKGPAFLLLFILQMSQGPVGAMPRLVTLMHASIQPYFPMLSLAVFSLLICFFIFGLTIRPKRIVHLLGSVLTPLLLLTLSALVLVGIHKAPEAPPAMQSSLQTMSLGWKMGYQTTDLIAALLFAMLILPHLSQGIQTQDKEQRRAQIRKRMVFSSLIAASLLMISYIGLCWISAHYSSTLGAEEIPSEQLLQAMAQKILGPLGGCIASVAVFLACLTTLISLAAVFSSYLKKDLVPQVQGEAFPLALTLGVSALMANLGFTGLVRLWSPLLEVLYPALIGLCLVNIAHCLYRFQPVKAPVFFILGFAAGGFCFG